MNVERFNKLIEAVQNVPATVEFDMSTYLCVTHECGTVACAVGSYVLANPDCGLPVDFFVIGKVADHFDITCQEVCRLFLSGYYNGDAKPVRDRVLRRLRTFVQERANSTTV